MEAEAGLDNTGPETDENSPTGSGEASAEDTGSQFRAAPDLTMPKPGTPDLSGLAQDWITLWQSELSAMAADPEIRESWQTMMSLWAGAMAFVLRTLPRDPNASRHDGARRRSGPADAPRTTPAPAAPDARDAEIERLARHVTALECRLAELERGGNPAGHPKVRPGRKQRR
jgi:hypothetical protein